MTTQYYIATVADLLKVPADRRGDCLGALELGLATFELAYGDEAHAKFAGFTWTADGDESVTVEANGETLLTLKVVPATSTIPPTSLPRK